MDQTQTTTQTVGAEDDFLAFENEKEEEIRKSPPASKPVVLGCAEKPDDFKSTENNRKRGRSNEQQLPDSIKWDGSLLCFLQEQTQVALIGKATVTCILGTVQVQGYELPIGRSIPLESPIWMSALVLVGDANSQVRLESAHSRDVSFQVSSIDNCVRPLIIPGSWDPIANEILQGDELEPPRLIICGGKGVGKSTCLRFMVNRLLSRYPHIFVLDGDAGQPELSPPGLVTLTKLSTPLLKPPSSNLRHSPNQQQARFYGSVTSKTDPTLYMDCLKDLIQAYDAQVTGSMNHSTAIPLVVNLDGWVKGMGYQILTSLVKDCVRPSHVIRIMGAMRSQMFELKGVLAPSVCLHSISSFHTCPRTVSTTSLASLGNTSPAGTATIVENTDTTAANTYSAAPTTVVPAAVTPLTLRTFRICSYFLEQMDPTVEFGTSGIADPDCTIARHLAAQAPYAVPFEAVEFFLLGEAGQDILSEDGILDVLNGSIVGLCCRQHSETAACHSTVLPCKGLGIVRSIDRIERLFYVLTPVTELESVNVLVGGKIGLPVECVFRGVFAEAFPYLSFDTESVGVGAGPMKSSSNLGTR